MTLRHPAPPNPTRASWLRTRALPVVTATAAAAALVLVPVTAQQTTQQAAAPATSSAASTAGSPDGAGRPAPGSVATEVGPRFRHRYATVDGVRMHYVTGGRGPALVLLHGWPQSWFAWHEVMPALARTHTVYAVDLPGLGDSTGRPPSYDKATLARMVRDLMVERLGRERVRVVGHDLGAGVGFQYAAQFPREVVRYAHLDYPLPGPALSAAQYRTFSWHLAFHDQRRFPELLVRGRERAYLDAFYRYVAFGGAAFGGDSTGTPFTRRETTELVRTYRRPTVLRGGFGLYRTLDRDERDNRAAGSVDVPTLLLAAQGGLAGMRATTDPLLPDVRRAVEVRGAGHWLMEERPRVVTRALQRFLR